MKVYVKVYKQLISIILSVCLVGTGMPVYAGESSCLAVPGVSEMKSSFIVSKSDNDEDKKEHKTSGLRFDNADQIPSYKYKDKKSDLTLELISYKWRKKLAICITVWHTGWQFSWQYREASKILNDTNAKIKKEILENPLGLLTPDQKSIFATIELNDKQIKALEKKTFKDKLIGNVFNLTNGKNTDMCKILKFSLGMKGLWMQDKSDAVLDEILKGNGWGRLRQELHILEQAKIAGEEITILELGERLRLTPDFKNETDDIVLIDVIGCKDLLAHSNLVIGRFKKQENYLRNSQLVKDLQDMIIYTGEKITRQGRYLTGIKNIHQHVKDLMNFELKYIINVKNNSKNHPKREGCLFIYQMSLTYLKVMFDNYLREVMDLRNPNYISLKKEIGNQGALWAEEVHDNLLKMSENIKKYKMKTETAGILSDLDRTIEVPQLWKTVEIIFNKSRKKMSNNKKSSFAITEEARPKTINVQSAETQELEDIKYDISVFKNEKFETSEALKKAHGNLEKSITDTHNKYTQKRKKINKMINDKVKKKNTSSEIKNEKWADTLNEIESTKRTLTSLKKELFKIYSIKLEKLMKFEKSINDLKALKVLKNSI